MQSELNKVNQMMTAIRHNEGVTQNGANLDAANDQLAQNGQESDSKVKDPNDETFGRKRTRFVPQDVEPHINHDSNADAGARGNLMGRVSRNSRDKSNLSRKSSRSRKRSRRHKKSRKHRRRDSRDYSEDSYDRRRRRKHKKKDRKRDKSRRDRDRKSKKKDKKKDRKRYRSRSRSQDRAKSDRSKESRGRSSSSSLH